MNAIATPASKTVNSPAGTPPQNEETEEIWLPIPGYEESYEISCFGRVRSKARSWISGSPAITRTLKPRILKAQKIRNGYLRVDLSVKNSATHCMIHRTVCEVFHGPGADNMVARHLNGDKTDNRSSNLAWGTYSENNGSDKRAHGTILNGERHHKSKLSEVDVLAIRALPENQSIAATADLYGVTKTTIHNVLNRMTWKHIGEPT